MKELWQKLYYSFLYRMFSKTNLTTLTYKICANFLVNNVLTRSDQARDIRIRPDPDPGHWDKAELPVVIKAAVSLMCAGLGK
jgi:hypothetical protein